MTHSLKKRILEHFSQCKTAAKYTKSHIPVKIEAVWTSSTKSQACKLEYYIKLLSKSNKEKLIQENCLSLLNNKIDIDCYKRED